VRAAAGQAARLTARHSGRLLHFLAQLAFALTVVTAACVGGLAWRLAQGPLNLPWLAHRLEAAVNADQQAHLALGGAALAWEGFSAGTDQPLDIRIAEVVATDANGLRIAAIPRAEVTLSVGALLHGQLVPRSIVLDGARLRVTRAADGAVTVDLSGFSGADDAADAGAADGADGGVSTGMLRELGRPPADDAAVPHASRWSQLRRLRIHDAAAYVVDRQHGVSWQVPALEIDARRPLEGGLVGTAEATLLVGDQRGRLSVQAVLHRDSDETELSAQLSEVTPALLASDIPGADALAAVAAPVTLSGTMRLSRDLQPLTLAAHVALGAGTLKLGRGNLPILSAELDVSGTPERMHAALTRLELAARPGATHTLVRAVADVARGGDGAVRASGTLDLDRMAFADLPALWPEGIGGPGSRPWITKNITDGTAHDGHVAFALTAPADLSDATLTELSGSVAADDFTIHWLRPVPPVEHAAAVLTLTNPDRFDIAVLAGRQAGGAQGGLQLRGGHVALIGLAAKEQFADIETDLVGPVPDLLTLLRDPKVKLLDRSPLKLRDAAGQIAGHVTVTRLPLRDAVTMDDVQIRANAKLTGLRLAGVAAGRDVDRGNLTLEAGQEGLHASGAAQISGVPAQVRLDIDFRAGPPSQPVQTATVSATLDAQQLAAFGLDSQGVLTGVADISATVTLQRDGRGEVALHGDLTRAALALDPLDVAKPVAEPATLDLRVKLAGDRVTGIDHVQLQGKSLRVAGDVTFEDGQPDLIHLEQAILGRNTEAHGQIKAPRRPGDPWVISLAGASLDVASQLARKPSPPSPRLAGKAAAETAAGPAFLLDAQFGRVVLGATRALSGVAAHVEHDGRIVRRAHLSGQTIGPRAPFEVSIAPQGGGRRLTATAGDTGALLRAFDVLDTMQGGKLALTGNYDDARADHPLAGTLHIDTFRIRDAPILGRLLKAMTLYGLVDVLSGPGLGFARLEAPFRFTNERVELTDARAFSASLGMTAKGEVDLGRKSVDLEGTIVPAYFFNSLLGQIPLIGRLFSPERGGGVFSATYSVRGKLDDPSVGVNPLAALTPGVLRKLFGIFDTAK
jgi:AsmA-like C-terminal region/Protein of unknown function